MKRFLLYGSLIIMGMLFGGFTTYYSLDRYNEEQAKAILYVSSKHYENKEYDIAVALLNQSIGKNPNYYAPYQLLGNIYDERGNPTLALQMYALALDKLGSGNIYVRQQIQKRIGDLKSQSGITQHEH